MVSHTRNTSATNKQTKERKVGGGGGVTPAAAAGGRGERSAGAVPTCGARHREVGGVAHAQGAERVGSEFGPAAEKHLRQQLRGVGGGLTPALALAPADARLTF